VANSGSRVVAVLAAAACGACDDEPPQPVDQPITVSVEPQQPPPPRRVAAPLLARRTARWDRIEAANCVFFSGPNGRDTKLVGVVEIERAPNDAVEVRFLDAASATFTGTIHDGELRLERRTDYNNYGDAWKTTETIEGRLVAGRMATHYHYEECKVGDPPCPGTCTIEADLTFVR
jgi:hypothetical protein